MIRRGGGQIAVGYLPAYTWLVLLSYQKCVPNPFSVEKVLGFKAVYSRGVLSGSKVSPIKWGWMQ